MTPKISETAPILFRPVRQFLDEAMSELQEFPNMEALRKSLFLKVQERYDAPYEAYDDFVKDFKCEKYGEDDQRIGWEESYLVEHTYTIEGYCTPNVSKADSLAIYKKWQEQHP